MILGMALLSIIFLKLTLDRNQIVCNKFPNVLTLGMGNLLVCVPCSAYFI